MTLKESACDWNLLSDVIRIIDFSQCPEEKEVSCSRFLLIFLTYLFAQDQMLTDESISRDLYNLHPRHGAGMLYS